MGGGDCRVATASTARRWAGVFWVVLADSAVQLDDVPVWQVGPGQYAAIVALQAKQPASPARYKAQLAGVAGLVHVTVEVNASAG